MTSKETLQQLGVYIKLRHACGTNFCTEIRVKEHGTHTIKKSVQDRKVNARNVWRQRGHGVVVESCLTKNPRRGD